MTFLLILASAGGGWYIGTQFTRQTEAVNSTPPTKIVESESTTPIRGIGKLEPQSGVIKVMAPIGQQVESLFDLKIGSEVITDQPIVKLAGAEKAEMELQLALANKVDAEKKESFEKSQGLLQRQAAELALEEARSKRDEIENKSQGVELLRAQFQLANEMLQKLENLKSNPATSRLVGQSEIDKQRLVVHQLRTKIGQSEDEIRLAKDKIERAERVAELDIERIEALLRESALPMNSLNTAINAANKAIDLLEIKSPINGKVLDIVVRPGDTATNQPVMLIGDTSKMVCVAEINDSSLHRVQVGATATVSCAAIEQAITGKVVSKGVMIGPPSMKDPNPFARVDRKTGQVVIELDNSSAAANFVNLQVDVAIESSVGSD